MKQHIKHLGNTGLDIFFRRIQRDWEEVYPFVDKRTLDALEKVGLPSAAKDLKEFLDKEWENLKVEDIKAGSEDEKKRNAFVRILERAVGADLEGNIDRIRSHRQEASGTQLVSIFNSVKSQGKKTSFPETPLDALFVHMP